MRKRPVLAGILGFLLVCTVFLAASFTSYHMPGGISLHLGDRLSGRLGDISGSMSKYLAGVFFTPSITVADLMTSSNVAAQGGQKIKILIMPGHEPDSGGAVYRDVKERDVVVKIADDLAGFLNGDENTVGNGFDNTAAAAVNSPYDVIVARDTTEWNPIFQNYFTQQWPTLQAWVNQYKSTMIQLEADGQVTKATDEVDHIDTPTDPASRLYAINKWVDENNIDIAIHIHLNDYPRADESDPGKYTGFAIYVPEHQYSNAGATKPVADDIFNRLSKYFPVSDFSGEAAGIVEDQDLIAVGSNNTVNAVSMLIEYSYIYEQMFSMPAMQDIAAKEFAYQTYLGLQDFFGGTASSSAITLPYTWNKDFHQGDGPDPDIFAMQVALVQKGYYPPSDRSHNDCSLTGTLGPCTMEALSNFQKNNGIAGENYFGPQTRTLFNKLFSGNS